ncbi:FG-GAP repeat protein [Engelhardtia mirabilis]|uniref:FG-GAP repeat protein n=1 Tax=Engelhardtia mirabilis TaxID=2528011 RepID=A0A518BRV5_9BACT|nr:hypothetical protein Pla133_48110 [Planctomycetes bacterium Pla133]QDV04016.1 hypothetical protein Pla86_48090 [Planctomycetes bacterium Pla86]
MNHALTSLAQTLLIGSVAAAVPTQQSDEVKLLAGDPGLHDHFGRTLSLWGERVVVGSRFDGLGGVELAGSAYVFLRQGDGWVQEAKLTAADAEAEDVFGHAVAIFGDTALVGARNDDHAGGIDAGSAYVFVRDAGGWSQQAKLTAGDAAAGDHFGVSVAIAGDLALVGALYGDAPGAADAGSVYVFRRSGASWSQEAELNPADAAALDGFGWIVALDGETALIGSRFDDVAGVVDAGSAYLFERNGAGWSEVTKFAPSGLAAGDEFGSSVALEGDTAVVGTPRRNLPGAPDAGTVLVYRRDGAAWSQEAALTASDAEAGDSFGHRVALHGDLLAVGAAQDDHAGGFDAGSAYLLRREGSAWTELTKFTASDASDSENYGSIVAVADDLVLVGAPHDDIDGLVHAGSVYAYPLGGDCNGNGSPDLLDLAAGTSLDLDGEGTPDECQALAASAASISIAAGGTVDFALGAGATHAAELYVLLGSLSGTAPGLPVDGLVLPLNVDGYLLQTLGGGGPLVAGIGLLDGAGAGSASLTIPAGALPTALAGATVHHAFAAFDLAASQVTLTSNAIPTALEP